MSELKVKLDKLHLANNNCLENQRSILRHVQGSAFHLVICAPAIVAAVAFPAWIFHSRHRYFAKIGHNNSPSAQRSFEVSLSSQHCPIDHDNFNINSLRHEAEVFFHVLLVLAILNVVKQQPVCVRWLRRTS